MLLVHQAFPGLSPPFHCHLCPTIHQPPTNHLHLLLPLWLLVSCLVISFILVFREIYRIIFCGYIIIFISIYKVNHFLGYSSPTRGRISKYGYLRMRRAPIHCPYCMRGDYKESTFKKHLFMHHSETLKVRVCVVFE